MNGARANITAATTRRTGTSRLAACAWRRLYSLMTGANVQSASVTNTASKNTSIASHVSRQREIRLGARRSRPCPARRAMTTGTVIGYSRTGSSTSRECARTSIAANSVPTDGEADRARSRAGPPAATARGRAARRTASPTTARAIDLDASHQQQQRRAACRDRPPAARPARAAARAASRACRSRSNARPSASVPENATATQRMPAAASSSDAPFAHEREREDQHARDARRTASCTPARGCAPRRRRSLRAMSQAAREDAHRRAASAERARGSARAACRPRPAIAARRALGEADRAIDEAVRALEVVRGHHDDRARAREARAAAPTSSAADSSSRPVNGSSSSTSRGSCRSARSSASRWRSPRENPRHAIVRAIGQARRRERLVDARLDGRRRRTGVRRTEVLARREIAVEKQVVAEHADAPAQGVAGLASRRARRSAPPRPWAGRAWTSMPSSVDLPAPFGPSRPTISPGAIAQRDVRQRAAPAVVARDVADLDDVEIARRDRPPRSGSRHASARARDRTPPRALLT